MRKIIAILAIVSLAVLCFAHDKGVGVLSVESSEPAGVWLNGEAVGVTPFTMEVPAGWVVYTIRSPGYWTEVFLAHIKHGEEHKQNVQLKKSGQPASEMPEISHINDLRTLESLYDSLFKRKSAATLDSVCIAAFVADYPLPASPHDLPGETAAEYHHYYNTYNREKELSFNEWHANCSGPIEQNMNGILGRINQLGANQVSGFVPASGGKFESAAASNGLKGNLELNFRSPDGRADVIWKGAWENDFLTGDALVRALTASAPAALAFLTVQNQTVWIPVEGGFSRHFYKYYDLNISWNGLLIPMKGSFSLPEWLAGVVAPKDSLEPQPQPPAEEPATPKPLLAKIPGGNLTYKGKDLQIKPFAINISAIDQGLYKDKCGKKDFNKYKGDSLPAHSVNWKEANSCCIALGGELPTEAEWEYAARAGSPANYIWPNNANPKDYAEFNGKKPVAVAGKKPNGWGLYDMFGNVAEWVKDDGFWFGKYKYLKGGSWKSGESDLNIENSEEEDARYWGTHTGFRCVFKN
ncbi:MAG: SUMF1/EgtB/PvdO family nonheme iron enzyme [Candidatus Fibromonas sp.]|jgi:formylglycine-generating enzyme required for sulfatase activity|nr:SUMF1/EgtB/PvdO family nonheme iron enzyme [Candidatus Fibromonas sp.]